MVTDGAEVWGREHRVVRAARAALFVNRQVHLVVAADLPTVAAEEECGVPDGPQLVGEVITTHQVHPVLRRGPAEAFVHASDRDGENIFQRFAVAGLPFQGAERIFRQRQHVAAGLSGLGDGLLELGQVLIDLFQRFGR